MANDKFFTSYQSNNNLNNNSGHIKKNSVNDAGIRKNSRGRTDRFSEHLNLDTKIVYSFSDVFPRVILPFQDNQDPVVKLPGLTLLSLSEHRDTYPVTSLGRKGIDSMTVGHALTAGSLGFTVFDEDPFYGIIERFALWSNQLQDYKFLRPHDLPPFDLLLVFLNEKQQVASMIVKSLKILDSSTTLGVDAIKMTSAYSFMATQASTFVTDGTLATFKDYLANNNIDIGAIPEVFDKNSPINLRDESDLLNSANPTSFGFNILQNRAPDNSTEYKPRPTGKTQ